MNNRIWDMSTKIVSENGGDMADVQELYETTKKELDEFHNFVDGTVRPEIGRPEFAQPEIPFVAWGDLIEGNVYFDIDMRERD